jgi:enamine deaminase RidA (YjgF/YER057c/UK114 family)
MRAAFHPFSQVNHNRLVQSQFETGGRRMNRKRWALAALACGLVFHAGWASQKKKKEVTQTLQLPKDLPSTVIGEPRRLAFHVTPLSAKGLLSAQVRDALKALARETGGNTVLRIRAFVAGSGDLRRVRDLVSETFTDRKQPLPVLTLVQSGGLPLEGAQVVLEAVSAAKKDVNPEGLIVLPAPIATSENPLDPVLPLATKSLSDLKANLHAAGAEPADVLRVTCFLSSLDNLAATRKLVDADYPRAALNFVQTQRAPVRAVAACEAVARLDRDPGQRLRFVPSESEPKAVLIAAPRVVLTGAQVSYGYQEADSRLAFERLQKSLEAAGVSKSDTAFTQYYALADPLAAQIRQLGPTFFGPTASSILLFEGLPSMQAGFAADVIAVKE